MMFRSYSNTSEYFLRDYVAKAMVIMLSSRVKISCLRAKAHLVFHWCLYNKCIFFAKRGRSFMSRTVITSKFKMRWLPNEGRN